jgi:hypothetical protein
MYKSHALDTKRVNFDDDGGEASAPVRVSFQVAELRFWKKTRGTLIFFLARSFFMSTAPIYRFHHHTTVLPNPSMKTSSKDLGQRCLCLVWADFYGGVSNYIVSCLVCIFPFYFCRRPIILYRTNHTFGYNPYSTGIFDVPDKDQMQHV